MMVVLVMAGGAGTRLWPASRTDRPKQFLPLLAGRSPLAETLARAVLLAPPERVWVSANAAHRDLVEASLSPGMRAVYEPCGRGTAPCLGLAALQLAREDPEAVMVAMPADNWVGPGATFCVEAGAAADLALRGGLVVVATKPTGAAGGFGYLKTGCPVETGSPEIRAFSLEEFIEKPDQERAAALCADGWLWNAGLFAFKAAELLRAIEELQPDLGRALARIRATMGTPGYEKSLVEAWGELAAVSFEEGILARSRGRTTVIRGRHAWSDLGTWDAVRRIISIGGAENGIEGDALLQESRGCLVRAEGGRLVAVVGGEDLTVIDTPDALLVLGPGHGQEVREVVRFLAERRAELV